MTPEQAFLIADYLFLIGGIIASISLLPTVRNKTSLVPLQTSIPTTIAVGMFLVAQFMLGLYLAGTFSILTFACWLFIALRRNQLIIPPQKPMETP